MTPLPTPPSTLRPTTFASEMDAFLEALPVFQDELDAAGTAAGLTTLATSTTSLTIGTGSQSLTVQTGRGYIAGMDVAVAYTTAPTTRMLGTVTSYDSGTGALAVEVASVSGSGTYATWSVSPFSTVSFDGQTFTDLRLAGKITETVYALAGTAIDPANGSIQTKTLSANTTFTHTIATGQSVVLVLTAGAYTVTWPTMVWGWGTAPTLPTVGKAALVLFNLGDTLYGIYAGSLA